MKYCPLFARALVSFTFTHTQTAPQNRVLRGAFKNSLLPLSLFIGSYQISNQPNREPKICVKLERKPHRRTHNRRGDDASPPAEGVDDKMLKIKESCIDRRGTEPEQGKLIGKAFGCASVVVGRDKTCA